jgi:site-specific DNA-methyltransferase (adenine-specific)
MKPYYQDDAVTLYHGDCRDVLPQLTPVAAVITDPPYNVGLDYGPTTNDRRPADEYEAWCRVWFAECRRLAPVVAFSCGIVNVAMWCRIAPPDWILAWVKRASTGRSPVGFNNWEPVLLWGKPDGRKATDVLEVAVAQFTHTRYRRDPGHPALKPRKWANQLVALLTQPGDAVLDPFAGGGAVLGAARDLGRRAVGVEINPDYCAGRPARPAQQPLPLEA